MVTDDLRRALREARKRSGISFARFARLAGFSESHLRSVENGQRALTDGVARAYDSVLHTGGRFQSAVASAPLAWDRSGTLSAISRVLSRSDLDRRAFVIASGASLAGLAGRWQSALDVAAGTIRALVLRYRLLTARVRLVGRGCPHPR